MITFIIVQGLKYLTQKQVLYNCYDPDTSVHMINASQTICIQLINTQNPECNVLQQGLNVTVSMIIPQNQTTPPTPPTPPANQIKKLFGYFYNFSYNETKLLCIDAGNPKNVAPDYYQASTVQINFDSVGYITDFTAGLVQKITANNSQLMQVVSNNLLFNESFICYTSILNTNFTGEFHQDYITNVTLELTYYYPNATPINYTVQYNKNKTGQNSNISYVNQTKNLTVCYTGINGMDIYVRLYRTDSIGYITMHYNIPNTTQVVPHVLTQFDGKSVKFDYNSKPIVYKQMNVIIMNNMVALQIVLDPTKESIREGYQQLLRKDQPKHTALKQLLINCQENPQQKVVVYTHNNINFINASQLFKYDIYQPNQSIADAMKRLWQFQNTTQGCTPQFEYQLFGFDQTDPNKIIMIYKQGGNYTKFTCFKHVKFSAEGSLDFIRNDIECPWLQQHQNVTFKIINEITRVSEGNFKVTNFSVNNTNYNIPLNFRINATIMTLQIINFAGTMIEQVELSAVSEAQLNVVQDKLLYVIIFTVIQGVVIGIQMVLKKLVMPKLVLKLAEQRIARYKAKNCLFDL